MHMRDFNEEIGFRIRTLREQQGYSRERLSEMSKIGVKFLYEIEVGKKGMSAYTLINIAKSLNVTTDYLLKGGKADKSLSYIDSMLATIPEEKLPLVENIIKDICNLVKDE